MGVAETISIYLTHCIFIFYKWVCWRNSILAICTVSASRIYAKNASPGVSLIVRQALVSVFNSSSITHTDMQQSIVFISLLWTRIESDLLNTMNAAYHIYSH